MNNELLEALNILEKEKNISKDTLLEAIETSLITACKNHFGKSDNVRVDMNPETCEYHVYQSKTVVEEVADPVMEISLANAKMINSKYELDDIVNIEIKSKEFGRIATQNAKNVILQKIREEERKVLCDEYYSKEKDIVTGIVQRYAGRNVSINLGKVDAILTESEQVKGEVFQPTERIKLYILEVKSTSKGPKILVSRTHPELVKRLFESEVAEVKEGIVEIKSIAREAGSRTKIAVYSNDPDVDAVGACVGMNGARVNAIVNELRGEKIDIITWNDNPAMLIENALSPAKVISVIADAEEKSAKVVVPDYQLSLAIGKEGQNARLAARLTGFKIDIKSETQAREAGDFFDYENDYEDADEYEEYDDDAYGSESCDGEEYDRESLTKDGGYEEDSYAEEDSGYAEDSYAEDGGGYAEDSYAEEDGGYAEDSYAEDGGGYAEDSYAEEDGRYAEEFEAENGGGYAEKSYIENSDGYVEGSEAENGDEYAKGSEAENSGEYVEESEAEDGGGYMEESEAEDGGGYVEESEAEDGGGYVEESDAEAGGYEDGPNAEDNGHEDGPNAEDDGHEDGPNAKDGGGYAVHEAAGSGYEDVPRGDNGDEEGADLENED